MADRLGIFEGDEPFGLLRRWMGEATVTEPADPNAMSLATVGQDGCPNVRIVLLKEIEDNGLVFYTNFGSTKGGELDKAGKAAVGIHWKSLARQVRARGLVERVPDALADAYYQSRALESRIGAWASHQSAPLSSRQELEDRIAAMRRLHGDHPERPPHWGGYRIIPLQFEFWADGAFRLHDRFIWKRSDPQAAWSITRLSP